MTIKEHCACGEIWRIHDRYAGLEKPCPKCNQTIHIAGEPVREEDLESVEANNDKEIRFYKSRIRYLVGLGLIVLVATITLLMNMTHPSYQELCVLVGVVGISGSIAIVVWAGISGFENIESWKIPEPSFCPYCPKRMSGPFGYRCDNCNIDMRSCPRCKKMTYKYEYSRGFCKSCKFEYQEPEEYEPDINAGAG